MGELNGRELTAALFALSLAVLFLGAFLLFAMMRIRSLSGRVNALEEEKYQDEEFAQLNRDFFITPDGTVIGYRGKNYYEACDQLVMVLPDGSQTHCVRRVGHDGLIHEDYEGHEIKRHSRAAPEHPPRPIVTPRGQ